MDFVDLDIIKIFKTKEDYKKYSDYINSDILDSDVRLMFLDLKDYFEEFPTFNTKSFQTWFTHYKHPDLPKSKQDLFKLMFKQLEKMSDKVAEKVLVGLKRQVLQKTIEDNFEYKFDIETIQEAIDKYKSEVQSVINQDECIIRNDLDRILTSTVRANGLQWRLNCLQQSMGGLIKGDFVIIGAYVDVGKTTLAISEATHMAQQIQDGKVLWLNNEEYNDRVWKKIWQSTLGQPWDVIKEFSADARKKYTQLMNGDLDRIQLVDIRPKAFGEIVQLIQKVKPRLVVIDQLDKVSMPKHKSWSDHDRLKKLYGEMRNTCNDYCPVIAISQADATTRWKDSQTGEIEYQMYPDQSQLDGSKVGKPGEADAIIMIGQRNGFPNVRGIHVSKNKMDGIDENFRKIKAEVTFNGDISRYENPGE